MGKKIRRGNIPTQTHRVDDELSFEYRRPYWRELKRLAKAQEANALEEMESMLVKMICLPDSEAKELLDCLTDQEIFDWVNSLGNSLSGGNAG